MHRPRITLTRWLFRGLLVISVPLTVVAQNVESNAFSVSCSYVAESQIFTSPASPDPAQRTLTTEIDASSSYSFQYRRELLHSLFLETSLEYTSGEASWHDQFGTELSDGYDAYIVELSGLFALPFSGRIMRVYVGGGGGLYFGTRSLSLASAKAESIGGSPSFGIHVLFGMEWWVLSDLSLRGDIRFRDPQISVENQFNQSSVESNGVEYPLPVRPFPGDININGNVYSIGLMYYF